MTPPSKVIINSSNLASRSVAAPPCTHPEVHAYTRMYARYGIQRAPMPMSTISSDRSTVHTPGREVVIVTHYSLSRDMLISYINFIRQYMHLEPLIESQVLDEHAQKKAHALKRRSAKAETVKIFKKTQPRRNLAQRRIQSPVEAFSPFGESPEYLSCVLDHNCDSVGIYTNDPSQGDASACTVQVFGIRN